MKSLKSMPSYVVIAHDDNDVPASQRTGLDKTIGGTLCDKPGLFVLLTGQKDKRENGIWEVRAGAWEPTYPSQVGPLCVFVPSEEQAFYPVELQWGAGAESTWLSY